jgi:mRNA interferase RelE/StbE
MTNVTYTPSATRQMRKLTAQVRVDLLDKINRYAETGHGDVKKLQGMAGFRLRSGVYRVIFTVEGDTMNVVAAGHRSDIYR